MDRNKILQRLLDAIVDEADLTPDEYPEYTEVCSDFIWGEVSVFYMSNHKGLTVELLNEDYPERNYDNICEYIEGNLDRSTILDLLSERINENEWTSHGFRNAADYWNYRLG